MPGCGMNGGKRKMKSRKARKGRKGKKRKEVALLFCLKKLTYLDCFSNTKYKLKLKEEKEENLEEDEEKNTLNI